MRSSGIFAAVLLLSTPCLAWPAGVEDALGMLERAVTPLIARQQTTTYDLSFTGNQGNTATTVSSSAATTGGSGGSITITGGASITITGGASITITGGASSTAPNSNNATSTSQPEFDPRLPPGGISLITPNTALAVPTYYKIMDWVTFAWNYTSLSVTPSAVDVLASCARNQHTYTIALNQSIPTDGSAQTVLWDTGAFQSSATVPLLTETYTLIIHDAQEPVTARASAGYLGVFNQYYFGMYIPQAPTPYDKYVCVTCSGAMTAVERQTLTMILGVAGVTVASFTWFAGVAGLW